jgi:hypothetical protein
MCIPLIVSRQWLGKQVPAARNTRNSRRIVGRVCLWICLYIPLSLLGNNSVKSFPRKWIIVGGVVFYAVRVVSEERRRLVVLKTSCYIPLLTDDIFENVIKDNIIWNSIVSWDAASHSLVQFYRGFGGSRASWYLFACLAYPSTLKVDTVHSTEEMGNLYHTTRRHIKNILLFTVIAVRNSNIIQRREPKPEHLWNVWISYIWFCLLNET